jgi:hypothetical protein
MCVSQGHSPRAVGERRGADRLTESSYLAVLSAVRCATHVPHAVAALELMAAADLPPTIRTRLAICRMVIRIQATRSHPSRALPYSRRAWRELPSTSELGAAGIRLGDESADLVLEAHVGAILDRVGSLVRSGGDGVGLGAMLASVSLEVAPPSPGRGEVR